MEEDDDDEWKVLIVIAKIVLSQAHSTNNGKDGPGFDFHQGQGTSSSAKSLEWLTGPYSVLFGKCRGYFIRDKETETWN